MLIEKSDPTGNMLVSTKSSISLFAWHSEAHAIIQTLLTNNSLLVEYLPHIYTMKLAPPPAQSINLVKFFPIKSKSYVT